MLGFATWINLEIFNPNGLAPPQLAGLGMSLAGMIFGSLVSFGGGQKTQRTNRGSHGAEWGAEPIQLG